MQLQPSDALPKIMLARYYDNNFGRFLSPDPMVKQGANSRFPQRWNRYVYALNGPLTLRDPDGLDVAYENQYVEDLMSSTRAISPGTDATLQAFESNPSATLSIQSGDVPDSETGKRLAHTKTKPPSDSSQKPTEFEVKLDTKDMAAEGVDERGVVIHEIVGHVKTNSERSFDETTSLTPEQREEDAQDATVEEIESIPEEDRPTLPPQHKQPSTNAKTKEDGQ